MKVTRKYPHSLTLIDPNQVFPVRWSSTNSVHYETCPRCGAEPEFLCVTKSGKRARHLTGGAHGERTAALNKNHPKIADLSRMVSTVVVGGPLNGLRILGL